MGKQCRLLPTAYVVREEVIFSVCVSVHTPGGGTYLPDGGGGYLLSGLDGGGVPTFPGPGWGGYLLSGLDGGVPTFPGPGGVPTFWVGGYLLRAGWGVPT